MKNKFKSSLFRSLKPVDMSESMARDFGLRDIEDDLGTMARPDREPLFLRNFNADNLFQIMIQVGLVEHLENMGFRDVFVDVATDESKINYLKLYWQKKKPGNILLDLRLSESKFIPDKKFFDNPDHVVTYDMVVIEWLSAQNPRANFNPNKPQLPGQTKPGLGILKYCFNMLYIVAREVIKDGFLDIPDHFHGAVMYSKMFKFFDPAHEGVLRALMRDLHAYSLNDISWGIITKTIIEEYKNEPQPYDPSEQIFYVSDRLRNYFHSSKYRNTFNRYYKRKRFRFDYEKMVKDREEILKLKGLNDL